MMKRKYHMGVGAIALSLLLNLGLVQGQEQPSRRGRAEKLYNKYEYANAARAYETLVDTKKPSTVDMERLAHSYYYIKEYGLAENWYARIVELSDADKQSFLHYAEVLKQQGKYAEARTQYKSYAEKFGSTPLVENAILGTDSAEVWLKNPSRYKLRNEEGVNTAQAEFSLVPTSGGAIFAGEPTTTILGQKSGMTGRAYLRIYSASRHEDGTLSYPNIMVASLNNSPYHIGPLAADSTEETLYVTKTYAGNDGEKIRSDGKSWRNQNLELKIYKKDGEGWKEEDFAYNNVKEYSVGHASLSSDNKILYFASDMPGGKGGVDIWYCELGTDGKWGTPQNAGATINTPGDEMFPSVHENTLYFSSTGHVGMGGLDIFKAEGTKSSFTAPINLGVPVNSPSDDFAFVVLEAGEEGSKGYLSSNRTGGAGSDDIYSFTYQKPKVNIQLEGIARDKKTNELLSALTFSLHDQSGQLLAKNKTGLNGVASFDIQKGQHLKLTGEKSGYMSETISVEPVNPQRDTIIRVTMLLQSVQKVGEKFVLEDIYYDFDKYHIRQDAALILDKLVATMRDNPTLRIELSSHTDSRGSDSYNMSLSQKRAQAAVDYIVGRGIARDRMVAKGYGETRLVNKCSNGVKCTEEEHQKNRRTEIEVLAY